MEVVVEVEVEVVVVVVVAVEVAARHLHGDAHLVGGGDAILLGDDGAAIVRAAWYSSGSARRLRWALWTPVNGAIVARCESELRGV